MLVNGHWFKWHFYPPPPHKYGVVGEVGGLNPLECMSIDLAPKKMWNMWVKFLFPSIACEFGLMNVKGLLY